MSGTLIGFRGIEIPLPWSEGILKLATRMQDAHGWQVGVYDLVHAYRAIDKLETATGPIVMICHSAGASAAISVARHFGKRIDLAIAVDSWLPGLELPASVERVISVKAATGGRFHVKGANVTDRLEIPGTTHTTVDDAEQLHELVEAELLALARPAHDARPFYMGQFNPLKDRQVVDYAGWFDVPEAHLRAVIEIEAAGRGSETSGALRHLFEPHVIWRNLQTGANLQVRDLLKQHGHAYPDWRPGAYPDNPYPRTDEVVALIAKHHPAGLPAAIELTARACSWGLGQVLGENAELCGYASATDMVMHFRQSEANQLEGMLGFIKGAGLLDALRNGQWTKFALGYNGPKQGIHNYDGRLKAAAARWQAKIDARQPGEIIREPIPEKNPDKQVWDRDGSTVPVPTPAERPELPPDAQKPVPAPQTPHPLPDAPVPEMGDLDAVLARAYPDVDGHIRRLVGMAAYAMAHELRRLPQGSFNFNAPKEVSMSKASLSGGKPLIKSGTFLGIIGAVFTQLVPGGELLVDLIANPPNVDTVVVPGGDPSFRDAIEMMVNGARELITGGFLAWSIYRTWRREEPITGVVKAR
ncbi:MAG: N-acetylmuramidase family protein [Rhizobiaceae bacterium]|nr:N-acetylmuramidase family protein [Rhizobiaceae bacterium]